MTADSTNTPENAKPERIEDYFARLPHNQLQRECLCYWLALGDVSDLFNEIEADKIDSVQFVEKVREIVHDGMGIYVRRDEPWRNNIRTLFPTERKGDVA